MKTDETNFVRNRSVPRTETGPVRVQPAAATDTRAPNARTPGDREADAFDLWRARIDREAPGEAGDGPADAYREASRIAPRTSDRGEGEDTDPHADLHDVASIHGLDPESLTPAVAHALWQLSEEVAHLNEALQAAAHRIDRLEREVETDSLTGLRDRGGLLHEIAHMQSIDRRERGRSTLALLDLEEVPEIRRRDGRLAMEGVVSQVAGVLARTVAAGEVLAYLGEGEFAIILPGRPPEEAGARVRAILAEALGKPFRHAGGDHRLSATIGLAAVMGVAGADAESSDPEPESVLGAADRDLRRSRR
ncbi:GGDEF domain-containing protein [Marivibrio halodurans]|uniref:GGDEF domain-containing protein n=1 Tax=Marivibrio halodurans TaxID=2039722 RepID=A0A8J7S1N4_9PROT|nr:GGDEF domain-containing protein [Marivibrio halodurans]MBP5857039.1 GGDEF domain-containing protein [Marivibrio halodurans]